MSGRPSVQAFAAYHHRFPAAVGEPEVRALFTHLIEEHRVAGIPEQGT